MILLLYLSDAKAAKGKVHDSNPNDRDAHGEYVRQDQQHKLRVTEHGERCGQCKY